ncbi:hypothetical protein LCL89_15275 [Halobacillus yeomjeoni]|uniref:hypothetical protein n=1 Tax=Halobacillus yeomjeoni TaxID=311194 RepID=UPI001CD453DD|nr:hypothetical protein [Halobacillus yeomjeoni]MCA0985395.1 hypothetical protein [Halobacillus yeomjeoni]
MNLLSREDYEKAQAYIFSEGRPLEQARLLHMTKGDHSTEVMKALTSYQNPDGGFGRGIEPDFRLPNSSPLATSVALQVLVEHDDDEEAQHMITKALRYLEQTFDQERQGWFAVPEEVNDYPHAFWWEVHEDGKSWIDANWGNPSAEIIGYLLKYEEKVHELDVEKLTQQSLQHLMSLSDFASEHELYCYLRFFELHPDRMDEGIQRKLKEGVRQTMVSDPEQWGNYVPTPLKFQPSPASVDLEVPKEDVVKNLEAVIQNLTNRPYVSPTWEWNQYEESWNQAKIEWQGILTLESLKWLINYERIQS